MGKTDDVFKEKVKNYPEDLVHLFDLLNAGECVLHNNRVDARGHE